MYPSVSKKDRHHRLVGDAANRGEIETRHNVLSGAIQEVERGLKAKERDQEGHGVLGPISAELDRTLRQSRGELIAGAFLS